MTSSTATTAALRNVARSFYVVVAAAIVWEIYAFYAGSLGSLIPTAESLLGSLCHHLPDRTLLIGSRYLPVCARCTGIWIGWLLAAVVWWVATLRSRPPAAIGQVMPILVTAGLLVAVFLAVVEVGGWIVTSNLTRALLGMPLGLFAGWLLLNSRGRGPLGGIDEQPA